MCWSCVSEKKIIILMVIISLLLFVFLMSCRFIVYYIVAILLILLLTTPCCCIISCDRGRLLGRCSQGSIRKLILCEVLAHFIESIDGPKCQFGHLNPAIVHSFRVHHDEHQMQTVFFEGSGQTGTGRRSDSRFHTVEALA